MRQVAIRDLITPLSVHETETVDRNCCVQACFDRDGECISADTSRELCINMKSACHAMPKCHAMPSRCRFGNCELLMQAHITARDTARGPHGKIAASAVVWNSFSACFFNVIKYSFSCFQFFLSENARFESFRFAQFVGYLVNAERSEAATRSNVKCV